MGPKSYLQVPSETQENNRPPFEILESNGRFSSKNGHFCAYLRVIFPQDPQYLLEKAHMGPESYLQVCSEIMKKHFTSM